MQYCYTSEMDKDTMYVKWRRKETHVKLQQSHHLGNGDLADPGNKQITRTQM
jgi:hypothetical protein